MLNMVKSGGSLCDTEKSPEEMVVRKTNKEKKTSDVGDRLTLWKKKKLTKHNNYFIKQKATKDPQFWQLKVV